VIDDLSPAVLLPAPPPQFDLELGMTALAPVGSAAGMVGELVAHVLAELPAVAVLDGRDRLLAAAWLASLRSARTRRSYAADLLGWRGWLAGRGFELLEATRVQLDLWVRTQQAGGAGDASVRRRLSGIGSFYRYCLSHGLVGVDPTAARGGRGCGRRR
jgi:hypothetical protein